MILLASLTVLVCNRNHSDRDDFLPRWNKVGNDRVIWADEREKYYLDI